MSEWIKIDYSAVNSNRVEESHGVTTLSRLSPYDVPRAVRGRVGAEENSISIDFRYLDDEPCRPDIQPNGIILRFGKHSNRLFGIDIPASVVHGQKDIRTFIIDSVKMRIAKQVSRSSVVDGNHRIVAEVIRKESGLLTAT